MLFTIKDNSLKVLLTRRELPPYQAYWSILGDFINADLDYTAENTATRKIIEKTGVAPNYLEQLNTFSSSDRDPRGWSASIAYFGLIPYEYVQLTEDLNSVWLNEPELQYYLLLAFDHQDIIKQARERLKQKAIYSMLPAYCLPEKFTLGEYHQLVEIILEKPIQKKSFYRRFEASGIFEETGKMRATGARAAMLYKLKEGAQMINFERNLG